MEWNEYILKEWNGIDLMNRNEWNGIERNGMELSNLVWMF